MSKLCDVLDLFDKINRNRSSNAYSVGLSQDIQKAREELKELYYLADAYQDYLLCVDSKTEHFLNEISEEFGGE